jgi:hypothetical protein
MNTSQNELKRIEHGGFVIEFTEHGTFLFSNDESDRPEFSTREYLSEEAAKTIADAYHAGWHRGKTAGRTELALQLRTLLEIK